MIVSETIAAHPEIQRANKPTVRRAPLFAELFELADGNMQLLMIYNKIEIAAKTGDWPLMNQLYREFKIAHAALN